MRYTKDIKKIQPIVVNKVKHYTEKWRTVVVTLCQTIIPVPKCLAKCQSRLGYNFKKNIYIIHDIPLSLKYIFCF